MSCGDDPLSSFEIGDRVLVKQSQPGTLMFKGQTHFGSGHWAGVALDKAEGHNAGTYEGVKYFECRIKFLLVLSKINTLQIFLTAIQKLFIIE
uniref:CAP-Gly domain-containing protein n=1 Tax=Serinus canaria TaxID=9135 RepID=A0A8C9MGF5_SERCA